MSACISTRGEYSEHELSESEPFTCAWCGAFDEAGAVAADRARKDALGFIEQTIYANEDNSLAVVWTNAAVLEMLGEIVERLAAPESEHSSANGSAAPVDSPS